MTGADPTTPAAGPRTVAVLADVHGNLPALEAVLADVESQGVDAVVNLGDLVSGPLWPAATAERLRPLALPTVRGNHERQLSTLAPELWNASDRHAAAELTDEHRRWLGSLPPSLEPWPGCLLCHGSPTSDLEYLLEELEADPASAPGVDGAAAVQVVPASPDTVLRRLGDCRSRLVLCGHSHLPRHLRLASGQQVVNPGSVGLPAYDDEHPAPHRMESGSPDARYALLRRRRSEDWTVDLRRVAYDHRAAAARAESHGRPDWARALRTGFC